MIRTPKTNGKHFGQEIFLDRRYGSHSQTSSRKLRPPSTVRRGDTLATTALLSTNWPAKTISPF